MKNAENLEVNDIFSLKWKDLFVVAIVTDKLRNKITFDDIWSKDGSLCTGTTIEIKSPNTNFKFDKFIAKHEPFTPLDTLKKINPEYFL